MRISAWAVVTIAPKNVIPEPFVKVVLVWVHVMRHFIQKGFVIVEWFLVYQAPGQGETCALSVVHNAVRRQRLPHETLPVLFWGDDALLLFQLHLFEEGGQNGRVFPTAPAVHL
jgi:hypothetical protein